MNELGSQDATHLRAQEIRFITSWQVINVISIFHNYVPLITVNRHTSLNTIDRNQCKSTSGKVSKFFDAFNDIDREGERLLLSFIELNDFIQRCVTARNLTMEFYARSLFDKQAEKGLPYCEWISYSGYLKNKLQQLFNRTNVRSILWDLFIQQLSFDISLKFSHNVSSKN